MRKFQVGQAWKSTVSQPRHNMLEVFSRDLSAVLIVNRIKGDRVYYHYNDLEGNRIHDHLEDSFFSATTAGLDKRLSELEAIPADEYESIEVC